MSPKSLDPYTIEWAGQTVPIGRKSCEVALRSRQLQVYEADVLVPIRSDHVVLTLRLFFLCRTKQEGDLRNANLGFPGYVHLSLSFVSPLVSDALIGNLPTSTITYIGNRDETRRVLWNFFINHQDDVSFGIPDFETYMSAAMTRWNSQDDYYVVSFNVDHGISMAYYHGIIISYCEKSPDLGVLQISNSL
uniref:Uncharacterized protein n=1 Tax=Parascaris equorum TaxID=6256 RepID=A0A914RS51_PAREQ